MSSNGNGNGFNGRSPINFIGDLHGSHSGGGAVATRPLADDVVDRSQAVLSYAWAAMARVEREIDHLWGDSMKAEDGAMSQRLAEVSHTLRRAARLLQHGDTIG